MLNPLLKLNSIAHFVVPVNGFLLGPLRLVMSSIARRVSLISIGVGTLVIELHDDNITQRTINLNYFSFLPHLL
uniref:Uncharacterized protein n=1 Tax=Solanum lycopersicum TaxID=4081 RepID=A0A3Q7GC10_SOLLC